MTHILEEENDTAWKTLIRDRIMKDLEVMLEHTDAAFERKNSEQPPVSADVRRRQRVEYHREIQKLQNAAEAHIKAEIEREEQERMWEANEQDAWHLDGQIPQALVDEQRAILREIQSLTLEEHDSAFFEQGSSSRPSDSPQEPASPVSSTASSTTGLYAPRPIQAIQVPSAADLEARARAEKHERQQEEFRKRAEAILKRKQHERRWNNQLDWAETRSSSSSTTSVSDQESSSKAEPNPPMSQEDVINLVIFHDQQWGWMATLPHLQWTDFPWPVLSFESPGRNDELTPEAVKEYIFAPLTIHRDSAIVKDRLKDLIRRWHPDRFEVKYLARIADLHEREKIRQGAGVVARILNDLLGTWNDT
ncbi:hypothetical protein M413DRAFT_449325 [Hebeloma cylindrosporum]|uniref:Uncharacterized protein n=1 Tax=Hebeloma cylindrosporum TaxID=76867 RepID=A0A0C3BHS6_HEBCY|nr:hypothetical protein M413DRAFT_449325 [Hebeloma cylindrosporum h7]